MEKNESKAKEKNKYKRNKLHYIMQRAKSRNKF